MNPPNHPETTDRPIRQSVSQAIDLLNIQSISQLVS